MFRVSIHNMVLIGALSLTVACSGGLQVGPSSVGAGGPMDVNPNPGAPHLNAAAPMQQNGAVSPNYDPVGGDSLAGAINVSQFKPLGYDLTVTEDSVKSEIGPASTKLFYNHLEGNLQKTDSANQDVRFLRLVDWESRSFTVTALSPDASHQGALDFAVNFAGNPVPEAELLQEPNKKISFFITPASSVKDSLDEAHACSTHDCLNADEDWHVVNPK